MADKIDMDEVEKEVRDLILHSKSRRTTIFEPCNENNLSECLKSIHEELSIVGIKYRFDLSTDLEGIENITQTLVRLINSTWNLIMQHKEISTNGEKLKERNYSLQQNNFHLNNLVDQLKKDLKTQDNKMKQTEENKRQAVFKLDASQKELSKVNEEVKKYRKQLVSKEDLLTKQIKKLEKDNEQLQDKVRAKCGVFTPKYEHVHVCAEEYKIKEKRFKETISKLQERNRNLLLEIIDLKEEIRNHETDEFN